MRFCLGHIQSSFFIHTIKNTFSQHKAYHKELFLSFLTYFRNKGEGCASPSFSSNLHIEKSGSRFHKVHDKSSTPPCALPRLNFMEDMQHSGGCPLLLVT